MAKKGISKNSRAARRGAEDRFESNESKQLAKEPRLEETDKISPMIRSSLEKNQQLLKEKLQSKSDKKKDLMNRLNGIKTSAISKKSGSSNLISKSIKSKQRKFLSVDGRLGHKIDASIRRNRMVANVRKTGWEKINEMAKNSLNDDLIAKMDSVKKDEIDIEDEIAKENQMDLDNEEITESKIDSIEIIEKPNLFAMLSEE